MRDADSTFTPDFSSSKALTNAATGPGTWQHMVDSNKELLIKKTGQDTDYWVAHAREEGISTDAELREWMREKFGVTGYAQYAVSWEMFGYPDFMLQEADQLLDGQYAAYAHLRPIADAVLAWACVTPTVYIQMRKGFVSLHSPRRKFAQITRSTNNIVDVTLRLQAEADGRVERVRTRPDDPFTLRIRLTSPEQVDDEFRAILTTALEQNS
ncbi:hypothetical protein AB0280_00730 [Pseudarthrobacter sp902506025]|uniref:DUF5655 domain-containing protein n=1 Tax=Pseudarthrobacter defluvii TaxID=410837 RepID=A0ABT9UFL9_9MICC|nr:hypothetical protein [Pseudarthrobacter defluvii]MDQ0118426.1 hypothetical protein [Pseudarthrobacter defluvii]